MWQRTPLRRTIFAVLSGLLLVSGCSDQYFQFPHPASYFYENSAADSSATGPVVEESLLKPPSLPDLVSGKEKPPQVEDVEAKFQQASSEWFYGYGIGRTTANVGTIVLFPPYALYLLGNAGLELAGYEPLYVTNVLPTEPRRAVLSVYDNVTSVPGRLNSALGGQEFDSMGQ